MIKNKTLLLLIGEVINKFKNIEYFNKLDLIWEYNDIQIKEGNKWKVAFLKKGLLEPKVIYLWLCNLLETLQ